MNKNELIMTLRQQLEAVKAERQSAKSDPATLAAQVALKNYQAARLAITHADLLASADTHAAAVFFLNELYSAQDLTQRDADVERIIPTLERVMPYHTLEAITNAIVLDALSESMDAAMARRLGAVFTEADYIAAYRAVTRREDRQRQVTLVESLGLSLCDLVRIPLLKTTLIMMRGPARMAKLHSLQNFLERGFTTFKAMRDAKGFVRAIVTREAAISDNIYAGRAQPFLLAPPVTAVNPASVGAVPESAWQSRAKY
jgi:hypothetical protein